MWGWFRRYLEMTRGEDLVELGFTAVQQLEQEDSKTKPLVLAAFWQGIRGLSHDQPMAIIEWKPAKLRKLSEACFGREQHLAEAVDRQACVLMGLYLGLTGYSPNPRNALLRQRLVALLNQSAPDGMMLE